MRKSYVIATATRKQEEKDRKKGHKGAEAETKRSEREKERHAEGLHTDIYVYIYVYIDITRLQCERRRYSSSGREEIEDRRKKSDQAQRGTTVRGQVSMLAAQRYVYNKAGDTEYHR